MNSKKIKEDLLILLRCKIDENYKRGVENYFKEGIKLIGVRSNHVKALSSEYYPKIRNFNKDEILQLCIYLAKSNISELDSIALNWAYRQRRKYEEKDFILFEKWVKNHIHNWGTCDNFCTHILGSFLTAYPEYVNKVIDWSSHEYWPVRRVSAVAFIYPVRRGLFLKEAFNVSERLMDDEHYLVQKGYGWLLKDSSKLFYDEVFEFIMKYKDVMPRTALRYALERYPDKMRNKAMKRR